MASVARTVRQSLQRRSIRVLVSPTPITFAERRSILQVLEQYGPVEVFNMAPGFYSNFVSVTKEQTTADRLIASSPLQYTIDVPRATNDSYIADLVEPESFNSIQPSVTGAQGTGSAATPENRDISSKFEGKKSFKLEIFPAPYNHKFAMAGSPLHHSWPKSYMRDRSLMAATLKQSLPKNLAAKGLSHWIFPLGDGPRMDRKKKRLQIKSWLPSVMKAKDDG